MRKPDDYMRLALEEALRARGQTRPNPLVGAVVVKRGRIVATGFHARAGEPHAEAVALARAGQKARGADLYVTLEPCNHEGRTGPCTEAVLRAGVRRVFVGTRDPNPGVKGGGITRLRRAGVVVEVGVLEDECRRMNAPFNHFIVHKTPLVIAKLAQSLDGKVATRTGESKWITSEAARARGHALRAEVDGIVVGIGTVLADDPKLTSRIEGGRDPERIIVDAYARTPIDAKVVKLVNSSSAKTVVVTTAAAPERRVSALQKRGVEVVVCKGRNGRVSIPHLLKCLGGRDLMSVLVEGGPTLMGAFFDAGAVHEVAAFIAPVLIGGERAKSSVLGRGVGVLHKAPHLTDVQVETLGRDLLLRGTVVR